MWNKVCSTSFLICVLYRLCQYPMHIKYIHPFLKFIKYFYHFKWVSAFAVIFSFCYISWLHQWFIWCWILVLKFSSKSQHNFLKHRFGHVNSVLEPFRVSHGLQKSARSRREKKKIPGRLFVQSQATLSTLQSTCSKGRSHIAK